MRAPGVKGRSRIDDEIIVAAIMVGWVVGVRHDRLPVRVLGATVRVMA